MSASESVSGADRWVRLVPPAISLAFIIALIAGARCYDLFPVKPAPCGLRTLTGIPCLACGGTRSMRALAEGDIPAALAFNPLVIVGIVAVVAWFAISLCQVLFSHSNPSPSRKKIPTRWIVILCVLLVVANWVYLFLALPD